MGGRFINEWIPFLKGKKNETKKPKFKSIKRAMYNVNRQQVTQV